MTAAVQSDQPTGGIPTVGCSTVQQYVNKAWDPENCPHHALIGLTGSGKTYLGINGILRSMCARDRVLIIDTKEDDKLLASAGRPVEKLPKNPYYVGINRSKQQEREAFWYRLVVSDNRAKGREQIATALQRVYKEGDWVVYIDEAYDITAPRAPFYNLSPLLEQIWRKGRSRRVSTINATQTPAWVPRTMYNQASFAWIGRTRDVQVQKRLLEIGGLTKDDLATVSGLQRRQWLLAADNGEYFAKTTVTL
jgi:hypothetical protein